jgi:peptidyl-prolyl cis-trans isomerase SurA
MRSSVGSALLLFGLTGCQWLSNFSDGKADNPVMDSPPPRISRVGNGNRTETTASPIGGNPQDGRIRLVSRNGQSPDPELNDDLAGMKVVARVDNLPILASEILDRYAPRFQQVRDKATPAELRKIRAQLLKRDLKIHVERKLLVNAMRRSLPKEAREKLDKLIGETFDKEVQQMKQEMKVDSKVELEQKLMEQGTSLDNLRDSFANQQMAAFYFQSKVKSKKVIGRRDLLQYYEAHLKNYAIPAKVRWQEIQILFDKHGGKDDSSKLVDRVLAALKNGGDFAALAKQHSDGITAAKGGYWDWTTSNSLADEELDRALFQVPIGKALVHQGKTSFHIVRVTDRVKAGWKPFNELQTEIRDAIEKDEKKANARNMLDELMRNAIIWTAFDVDPDFRPAWRKP